VYPFGLDPKWHGAENGMTFSNSYKMKQSILFGLFQMNFGIILAFTNMVHFSEAIDIWCNFLPQLLFMLCLFGYLGVLILVKWITAADVSLLNLFITMVLRFGAVEGAAMYPSQQLIQTILMVIAISCIPWMLFAKPVYLLLEKRKIRSLGYGNADDQIRSSGESVSSTARKAATQSEEHSFGDMMVHQVIHTIEFVLGSVSNTASYLRLWALSLAHAQLSEVLWDMTIGSSITSMIMLPISFFMWLTFTLGIMVAMEGMSAFLHALRLHWVEFNNKFYRGTGVKFEPFVLRPDLLLANAQQQDDAK
jgi:V-type H+-transporting ATPase subunit a